MSSLLKENSSTSGNNSVHFSSGLSEESSAKARRSKRRKSLSTLAAVKELDAVAEGGDNGRNQGVESIEQVVDASGFERRKSLRIRKPKDRRSMISVRTREALDKAAERGKDRRRRSMGGSSAAHTSSIASTTTTTTTVRKEKTEEQKTNESLRRRVNGKNIECESLKSQLRTANDELGKARSEITELKDDVQKLTKENASLRKQVNALKRKYEPNRRMSAKYERRLSSSGAVQPRKRTKSQDEAEGKHLESVAEAPAPQKAKSSKPRSSTKSKSAQLKTLAICGFPEDRLSAYHLSQMCDANGYKGVSKYFIATNPSKNQSLACIKFSSHALAEVARVDLVKRGYEVLYFP